MVGYRKIVLLLVLALTTPAAQGTANTTASAATSSSASTKSTASTATTASPGTTTTTQGTSGSSSSTSPGTVSTASSDFSTFTTTEEFETSTTTDMPWGIPWWGWFFICCALLLCLALIAAAASGPAVTKARNKSTPLMPENTSPAGFELETTYEVVEEPLLEGGAPMATPMSTVVPMQASSSTYYPTATVGGYGYPATSTVYR
mmetsp:Transcript_33908/g.79298  ORF Transcript_33908/g.79298 Transcript_33908/m.79298 type:complete len:204 (-) Transcript_33908:239-850(-)|eukprot:CAMPEP_0178413494 /NCGR_PEP_ID=MMETSP0689_2-20121128/22555_1 /TAXON_ID=160604 /ORGANISM="Amphidinium massartii, Strain CS-259" /LENGTH=203 /DNA_ID=CAMNT_0020034765 /DNA_START=80 /DNA_END=691 /DNA_ORIENTATION=-